MKAILFLLLALLSTAGFAETIELASEARLWIKVPADQAPLREIQISRGRVTPANWERDAGVRVRLSDVIFPIHWWAWTEATLRLTPDHDGTIELALLGPWAADKDGGIQRQEVLWDGLSADGTILTNSSYEQRDGDRPAHWSSPWAPYPAPGDWPLTLKNPAEGKHFAATWHNRPLTQVLQVKKGKTVNIRLKARAATPPSFVQPKVISKHSPAHRALSTLKRGVNFGNGWEADSSWALKFTVADVDHVADEGFDHIRVPVAFHRHFQQTDSGMVLSPALLAELEPVLRRALERKLAILLDWHHFHDFCKDPSKHLVRFVSGWECISRHFNDWPPGLFYELLNEPTGALSGEILNTAYQKSITGIRRADPKRIIVVSPGSWGGVRELDKLRLPDGDERIVVTIHCYEPFHFTHQGAGWVGFQELKGIIYPGPPRLPLVVPTSLKDNSGVCAFIAAYNTLPTMENPCSPRGIRETLDLAGQWSRHFGRPVHLGEFGAHHTGDDASRARYLRDLRTLAEERKIPWTLWEWKSSFGYWNPVENHPRFRKELIE
jgi:endoglucanase